VDTVIGFVSENYGIVTIAATIGLAPAVSLLIKQILRLPWLRQTIRGGVMAAAAPVRAGLEAVRLTSKMAGKAHSALLTKWLGDLGRQMEDSLQELIEQCMFQPLEKVLGEPLISPFRAYLLTPYFEGLDADDGDPNATLDALVESEVVSIVEGKKKQSLAIVVEEVETEVFSRVKDTAGRLVSKVGEDAIKVATKAAIKKLARIF